MGKRIRKRDSNPGFSKISLNFKGFFLPRGFWRKATLEWISDDKYHRNGGIEYNPFQFSVLKHTGNFLHVVGLFAPIRMDPNIAAVCPYPLSHARGTGLIIFTFWLLLGRVLKIRYIQPMFFHEIIEISPVFPSQLGCLAYISFAHL